MPRVKRGTVAHRKREKRLKYTKGFRWSRKSKERAAKEALTHAWVHAFQGRKQKKRDYRALWNVKIGAALSSLEAMSYSRFIHALKKANVALDRKILADLAQHEPPAFKAVLEKVK